MAQAQTAVLQADPAQDKATAAKPSNVRWRIFAIVFALTVINLVDRVSLSIAMPTIAGEFQLTPSMQGLILSSFFWAYALLQIPGGWLIDRYGPRRVIGWSTGLWGAFQTLAAFASGGLSLMFARVALGAAEAPLFPSGGKLNSLWLGSSERSRGAVLMDCGGPLGVALGGLLIAYLIAVLGSWRSAFFIAGIAWPGWPGTTCATTRPSIPGSTPPSWAGSTPTAPPRSPKRTARPAEDWASPAAPWSVSSSAAPVGPWCSSAC